MTMFRRRRQRDLPQAMNDDELALAAAAVVRADRELAVSLVALLHGAGGDHEQPTLQRLAAFARELRRALAG